MPTYEYACNACGLKFERRQSMTDEPLTSCPECRGAVHRVVSGGAGFIIKGAGHERYSGRESACSLERGGQTCCGRDERCGKPSCGEAK